MCSSSPDAATRDVGDKNVATYFSGDINVDNVVSGHGRTRCADGFFLKNPSISPALPRSRPLVLALLNAATAACSVHDTKNCRMVVIRLGVVAVYGAVRDL
jgi:hypothetical protein